MQTGSEILAGIGAPAFLYDGEVAFMPHKNIRRIELW